MSVESGRILALVGRLDALVLEAVVVAFDQLPEHWRGLRQLDALLFGGYRYWHHFLRALALVEGQFGHRCLHRCLNLGLLGHLAPVGVVGD